MSYWVYLINIEILNNMIVEIGKRIEMLVVVERLKDSKLICLCDCGNKRTVFSGHFNTGKIKSCGCHVERHGKASIGNYSREYVSWGNMKARCHNHKNKRFKDYGAKGVYVCDSWRNSFKKFFDYMGECPDGYQIDRINNEGNYEPGNCRWVSPKENMANRNVSRRYVIEGIKFNSTLDAAKHFNVSWTTIRTWCEGRKTKYKMKKTNKVVEKHYLPKPNCYVEYIY